MILAFDAAKVHKSNTNLKKIDTQIILFARMFLQYFLHRRVVTIYQTSNNVFFTTHSNTFPSLMRKICIPESELKITFSSSSGPGGQNVNKLATKVDVR